MAPKKSAKPKAPASDSDDSDSDYNPENEKDAEEVFESAGDKGVMEFSATKKRKVDDLWNELKAADAKATSTAMAKRLISSSNKLNGNRKKSKRSKKLAALNDMHTAVFGIPLVHDQSAEEEGEAEVSDAIDRDAIRESVKKVVKKVQVLETRMFAGKEIRLVWG